MGTKGTYALVLRNHINTTLAIGRKMQLVVRPGYYIYVGSAFGPGGVAARLARHWRHEKKPHWHIDYLRAVTTVIGAWVSYDSLRLEHQWARQLGRLAEMTSVEGFGCSDCSCAAHLFFSYDDFCESRARQSLGSSISRWDLQGETDD